MGFADHRPSTRCGTWCAGKDEYHRVAHIECESCWDRWPCETAQTLEEAAEYLMSQPVLSDHYKSARLLAPWLDIFQTPNPCPFTFAHTRHWCGHEQCRES